MTIKKSREQRALDEATASINARTPIGATLRSKEWEEVPLALRQRAQFSAGVTSARVLQTIQDRLREQFEAQRERLATGKTGAAGEIGAERKFDRHSFINAVREVARAEGFTLAPLSKRGHMDDITSMPRLRMIYDMQNAMANGFARHKLDTNGEALGRSPAYRLGLSTAQEPRPQEWWRGRWATAGGAVSWEGANANAFIALKISPIWRSLSRFGTPWSPFDWGSKRALEDLSREAAEELGLIGEGWKPPEGAAGGEDFNATLDASVRGLDEELKQSLAKSFGPQVKFEADHVKWTGNRTDGSDPKKSRGPESGDATKPEPTPEPAATPTTASHSKKTKAAPTHLWKRPWWRRNPP